MADLDVRKLVVLSTMHLDPVTRDELSSIEDVTAWAWDYGWLLWVPDHETIEAADPEVPDCVMAVWLLARSIGSDYVLIDRDTPATDALPTYGEHVTSHEHVWGAFTRSNLAGTLHRPCLDPGCRVVSLDGDDD